MFAIVSSIASEILTDCSLLLLLLLLFSLLLLTLLLLLPLLFHILCPAFAPKPLIQTLVLKGGDGLRGIFRNYKGGV